MNRDDVRQAIFGISDGAATTLGLIFCLYVSGARHAALIAATVSAALNATISMGGGEYLGDDESSPGRAGVMALGTAVGGFGPAIPFFVGDGPVPLVISSGITAGLAVWVAEARAEAVGMRRAYLQTFVLFGVFCAAAIVLGLLLP